MIALDGNLGPENFSTPAFNREVEEVVRDFGLEKLKIFSASGKILYSTRAQDLGRINDKPYFREVVAKGNTYSKFVKKGTRSAEGRILTSDVVETYTLDAGRQVCRCL